MRRSPRASASRLCGQVCAVPVVFGMLLATPGLAAGEPGGTDTVASLVAAVANANQKLQELGAQVQIQQESVNKAIVDVQNARDNIATAQRDVDASRRAVDDANVAITSAQQRFDSFAASSYVNGPSSSYLSAADPADILNTAAVGQTLAASAQQVIANLQRARTEQVNKDSAARLAKQRADQAAVDAQASQDAAVTALTNAQQTFGAQQAELNKLSAERAAAQAKLQEVRPASPAANASADWDRAPGAPVQAAGNWDVSLWDPTLPAIPSAFVSGDPIAIVNSILGISSTSAQVTAGMGRNFLRQIGFLPTPSGYTNGAIPRVYGRQATEYVIRRGMTQLGVPYSWGGGNAAGPSRGIDSGAGTVGFDCSGLMLFMFAGVGIKLEHYSGSQYNAGRKIPSSQMRRGDMIFYGPNASQHVTMYLGNNQMLEAPFTGSHVKVSPVRTAGMTPYVTRLIEW
jgi:peptidoglycan DL-endopeptidase RipA